MKKWLAPYFAIALGIVVAQFIQTSTAGPRWDELLIGDWLCAIREGEKSASIATNYLPDGTSRTIIDGQISKDGHHVLMTYETTANWAISGRDIVLTNRKKRLVSAAANGDPRLLQVMNGMDARRTSPEMSLYSIETLTKDGLVYQTAAGPISCKRSA